MPYDVGALYTGHQFWELTAKESELLSLSGEKWLASRGLSLDMARDPGTIHLLAQGTFLGTRILRELVLIRLNLEKNGKPDAGA